MLKAPLSYQAPRVWCRAFHRIAIGARRCRAMPDQRARPPHGFARRNAETRDRRFVRGKVLRRNRSLEAARFDEQQPVSAKDPASQAASESDVISKFPAHLERQAPSLPAARQEFDGAQAARQFLAGGGQGKHLRMRRERDTKLLHRQERHAVSAASSKRMAACAARTQSANGPPPGTRMSGPPRRPALRAKPRSAAYARGCRQV